MVLTEEQKGIIYAALMSYGNKLLSMSTEIPNEQEIAGELSAKSKKVFALAKDVISDNGTGIKRAYAIRTCGEMYLYYAELVNGNWVMGNDGWLIMVDENPAKDEETFNASRYYDWQLEHFVSDISDVEIEWWKRNIIKAIEDGKTTVEYSEFILKELRKKIGDVENAEGR